MLAPQLVGRLLSEAKEDQVHNDNVCKLLIQCDVEGPMHNALVPTYHCLHTPGGPLKYSLEGHQFAIFGFKITSDSRYIVSVSNKFITWDISTSDLSREVHPKVEGLMMDLQISRDSRFVAAYTNNNQTVLLNTLISEYIIIDNPFEMGEEIQGLVLLDNNLIIFGQNTWCVYTAFGIQKSIESVDSGFSILTMNVNSLVEHSIICWSGDICNPKMSLSTIKEEFENINVLEFYNAFVINTEQTKFWACVSPSTHGVTLYEFVDGRKETDKYGRWKKKQFYDENSQKLLQLSLSADEHYLIGTYHGGFRIWSLKKDNNKTNPLTHLNLRLPNGVRNVSLKMNKSNACVLSAKNQYAISGIRKEMYIWCMKTAELVKCLEAHIARIIDIQSLVVGDWNCVITSSMDRTVKVWNINYIFEPVHHIDRHESQIESVSLSTKAGIAVTVTRGCVGVWNLLTGKLTTKLADSSIGAIVTHAKVTSSGEYIIAAESGYLIYWDISKKEVIYKEEQKDILQIMLFQNDTKCLVVSKCNEKLQELLKKQDRDSSAHRERNEEENVVDAVENLYKKAVDSPAKVVDCSKTVVGIVREFPQGKTEYLFEVPCKPFKPIVITSDRQYFVSYGHEKSKDMLFVHQVSLGLFVHKFQIKYPKYKDVTELVPIPDKSSQVAVIDQDKGNIIDIRSKKFVKSFPNWGGRSFSLYLNVTINRV
jgi:WD40 repeat protein